MAGILRFQSRQILGIRLDPIGKLQQQAAALMRRQRAPCRECGLRGLHRKIHVRRSRFCHMGEDGAVKGVLDRDPTAIHPFDPLPPDQQFGLDSRHHVHACQNVTETTGAVPSAIICGILGEPFSHTSSIERLVE